MSFGGFGKNSGPAANPNAQNPFGYFPPPPPPAIPRSPRDVEALGGIYSASTSFGNSQVLESSRFPGARRPSVSPSLQDYGRNQFYVDYDAQPHQNYPGFVPAVGSITSRTGVPANTGRNQDSKRNRPPAFFPGNETLANGGTVNGSGFSHLITQQPRSPPLAFPGILSSNDNSRPFGGAQGPVFSSPVWRNQVISSGKFSNPKQNLSSVPDHVSADDYGRKSMKRVNVQVPKRTRSPTFPSNTGAPSRNSIAALPDSTRSCVSPPKSMPRGPSSSPPGSRSYQQYSASERQISPEVSAAKPTPVAKRTKLPSLPPSQSVIQESSLTKDDAEKELQAKAKRLARFKDELNQPVQSDTIKHQKLPAKRQQHSTAVNEIFTKEPTFDTIGDVSNGNIPSHYDGRESASIIVGSCPKMCPEPERAERERKGDLDQYERLDGDRNLTSKSLAVKKYNRTAEREAELIRPMPVLEMTMGYLLDLLDQPYDDRFLGLYNFLWDRMRAIRMDLRMQHIFNLDAISMLERMIRLHIIAMHELCEYTKGEGFSEGFDAHLNIEQMNKTSVELFQLYDDHRKKGESVPTEKEFRGYYALLKLDKHPGYKVEPSELSVDLAKMTPNIRQTAEVLFARNVARACRTGNFIAFFRLARKASYLQACLMHAHFSKLRTLALASLHSGLQNNQGIPVSDVAKWLGMEDEDIELLLEYHGFCIKEFKEPYMVKEGAFVNVDQDYPVKCSKLVHRKKSMTIVEDVSYPSTMEPISPVEGKENMQDHKNIHKPLPIANPDNSGQAIDEEMADYETVSSPTVDIQMKPAVRSMHHQRSEDVGQVAAVTPRVWPVPSFHGSPKPRQMTVENVKTLKHENLGGNSFNKLEFGSTIEALTITPERREEPAKPVDSLVENLTPEHVFPDELDVEELPVSDKGAELDEEFTSYYDEEVFEAKLKLILRIWKRWSAKRRDLRQQRQVAANSALSSLSLGPPIRLYKDHPSTLGKFNVDHIMSKRYEIQEKSRSKLNVSNVVASTLVERNPDAKCICWKIVICSDKDNLYGDKSVQKNDMDQLAIGPWLLSKLCPTGNDDDDLLVSSPGFSIWKHWVTGQSDGDLRCCLSVIKSSNFENLKETVAGANAVLFLASDIIPWELQKNHLHTLLKALPSGCHLPLLILSGSRKDNSDPSSIYQSLGIRNIEELQLSNTKVVSLKDQQVENYNGFFSDDQLREGLLWLASEASPQPVLHCLKTRELVLSHLNSSLEVIDERIAHELGPEYCIFAFNEALNQSVKEVGAAALEDQTGWPCPEISLLEVYSDERRAVTYYLPSIGWSSAEEVEPILSGLDNCKLPTFGDVSWLYKGSETGDDIKNQKLRLEDCLIKYLSDSSRMMSEVLAKKEASVMIQMFAQLMLHASTYHIIPDWVKIFKRVFNWRLMNLSHGGASSAYILQRDAISASTSGGPDKFDLEDNLALPHQALRPSLDEMVEAACSSLTQPMLIEEHEDSQPSLVTPLSEGYSMGRNGNAGEFELDNGRSVHGVPGVILDDYVTQRVQDRTMTTSGSNRNEEDKLSTLLEKCVIMQNMIDKKLSIYF